MFTFDILLYLELLSSTIHYLCQVKLDTHTLVTSTEHRLAILLTATAEAAKTTESATHVTTKDVAKHREYVIHIHACATSAESASTIHTSKSELVILLTLLRVAENFISLCSLFEFLLSFLISRVTVWMVFDCHLLVSRLYLCVCSALIDAQDFVVISFLCH